MDNDQTNKFFEKKAKSLGVKVPFYFVAGETVYWSEIVENMIVILEATINEKFRHLKYDLERNFEHILKQKIILR